MAIITGTRTAQYLGRSIEEITSDRWCLNLLWFFTSHPNSRFGKLAIVHATDEDGSRLRVEKALSQLTKAGVLETTMENGACLYMLTSNEAVRQVVLAIAELDWRRWQEALKYSKPETAPALGYPF
jgi:hypothetical protein